MASDIRSAVPLVASSSIWGGPADPSCLLTSFASVVRSQPGTVAVVDEQLELSYAQLSRWISVVAGLLVDLGVRPGDRVAVQGSRSAGIVAAMLATVTVGATYVPLDKEYPARRIAHMLEDSGAKILLWAGEEPEATAAATTVRIPEMPSGDAPVPEVTALTVDCSASLPVYLIYTSGSTGNPKGVAVPHSCLDNMVAWQCGHSVRRDLRTAQFAPLNFDVCFQEILGTLCGGGTLVIVPERLRRDPFSLLDWLAEHAIERLFLPGVALNMLTVAASAVGSLDRLALKEVNTAGEQLVCSPAIREFFRLLPTCRLNNHYGQSESAMVSAHTLHGPSEDWPALPPIGSPLPGCELLLDPVDPADPTIGELLVAGLPLTDGYLNQPALSAERYVTVARTPQGHDRAFRTGDLVRFAGDIVQFISRADHEVKIRGYRVNPLEVDACLLEQPGVLEAVCVVLEVSAGSRHLRAAVTVEDGSAVVDPSALLSALTEVLPAHSVPLSITVVPELPRTPSGKIDRDAVTAMLKLHSGAS
ncbi:AMP-binding protein [Kitasatospora aureofaciens]|uniref:AMP-binding protein n=1 Tax=Kitasatospora aureofaciens TaxID=1894 RepID=UPI0037C7A90F